jgi:cytochrome c oxidase subunit 2
VNTEIKLIVSSADVIHCWTIPSLGVKVDAIPGRLNQINFIINRPGKFFGQCSELCGLNHSFMPISINTVSQEKFINWTLK